MPDRAVATTIAVGRLGLGLIMLVAPDKVGKPWIGAAAEDGGGQTVIRGLAARDCALALGQLNAVRTGTGLREWSAAAALADTGDAVAGAIAGGSIPRNGRLGVLAVASGAAVAGAWLTARGGSD
jgi:hypothetical protein